MNSDHLDDSKTDDPQKRSDLSFYLLPILNIQISLSDIISLVGIPHLNNCGTEDDDPAPTPLWVVVLSEGGRLWVEPFQSWEGNFQLLMNENVKT